MKLNLHWETQEYAYFVNGRRFSLHLYIVHTFVDAFESIVFVFSGSNQ